MMTDPRAREMQPISPLEPISPWPPAPTSPPSEQPPTESDELPTAKEIYGLIAVLGTYLAFAVYLIWAICPAEWLDAVGWTWYPSRDWALVIPCYLMVVVLLAYFTYASISAYLTPGFDSADLITDRHCNIPARQGEEAYYWKFADPDAIPEAVDLPIDMVNRVLYLPRKRSI